MTSFAVAVAIYIWYALNHPMPDWMEPVDLHVYRFGGLIAAHVWPWYQSHRAAPLYDWPGYGHLKFTYTPFAALVFMALAVPPQPLLEYLSLAVNTVVMLAAIWVTFRAVGWPAEEAARPAEAAGAAGLGAPDRAGRRRALVRRAGATLLVGAVMFWSEPAQRTLFLGQIELILMALIMWDLCQPDRHWWKGAGVGIAAGIKLVPLIFIPYLLLTRRYWQAAIAACAFAATVAIGFAVDPADSARWWFGGVFARGSRTGFVGWEGNQSLRGLIARFAGSVAGSQLAWVVAGILVVAAGLAAAAILDRAGHRVPGLLTCALTGVLVSPISWDHHWVWVVPAVTALAAYAARAGEGLRWAYASLAAVLAAVFFAWPGSLWGEPNDLGGFSLGVIWAPPNTNPGTYYQFGDRPWYVEYHWHGLQLLTGNAYVLAGAGLLVLAVGVAMSRVLRIRHLPVTHK